MNDCFRRIQFFKVKNLEKLIVASQNNDDFLPELNVEKSVRGFEKLLAFFHVFL
jgi:hypothetical protein